MSRSFPATSGEHDEEEAAALVPPSPEESGVASTGPPRPSLSAVLPTRGVAAAMVGLVFLLLLIGFVRWIKLDNSFLVDNISSITTGQRPLHHSLPDSPFTCINGTSTTCPAATVAPPSRRWPAAASTTPSCPDYFRYIHDDLRPWRGGAGITLDAMERARKYAYFRLVVVDGRAYVETYQQAFQQRDVLLPRRQKRARPRQLLPRRRRRFSAIPTTRLTRVMAAQGGVIPGTWDPPWQFREARMWGLERLSMVSEEEAEALLVMGRRSGWIGRALPADLESMESPVVLDSFMPREVLRREEIVRPSMEDLDPFRAGGLLR